MPDQEGDRRLQDSVRRAASPDAVLKSVFAAETPCSPTGAHGDGGLG